MAISLACDRGVSDCLIALLPGRQNDLHSVYILPGLEDAGDRIFGTK
nr:hypothetical protein [Halomicronema sp. CCY15110]